MEVATVQSFFVHWRYKKWMQVSHVQGPSSFMLIQVNDFDSHLNLAASLS